MSMDVGSKGVKSDINVTPLVDVVLVLLIIFMVITPAFGLLVAIPAVMMFNYLTNRVEDMQVDINDSANELVDFFMKEGRDDAVAAGK